MWERGEWGEGGGGDRDSGEQLTSLNDIHWYGSLALGFHPRLGLLRMAGQCGREVSVWGGGGGGSWG